MGCFRNFLSALVVGAAVLAAVVTKLSAIPDVNIDIASKDPVFHPLKLTPDQIGVYRRDGALFVESLISRDEAALLREEAERTAKATYSIFDLVASSRYKKLAFDLWRTNEKIASLALQSLPKDVAADLMTDADQDQPGSFRLLRDAFFHYAPGGEGCSWHVDDHGFWPAEDDTTGLTIWIALDDMSIHDGGGLVIANMSKVDATLNADCREALKMGTCDVNNTSPACYDGLQAVKMEWDMKPGDALLWDRFTFHRTAIAAATEPEADVRKYRYSIRYMPSSAKAYGFIHPTVQAGELFDSPYYPQVFPRLIESELKALEKGLDSDVSPSSNVKILGRVVWGRISAMFKKTR